MMLRKKPFPPAARLRISLLKTRIRLLRQQLSEKKVPPAPAESGARDAYSMLSAPMNITEQVTLQQDLAAEKERLAATLSCIHDAVISTNNEGYVLSINESASQLTGWNEWDALGKPIEMIFRVIDEASRVQLTNPVSHILSSGAQEPSSAAEMVLMARDNRETIVSYKCVPVRGWNRKLVGTVLAFNDTSPQRRIEDEVRKVDKLESIGVLAGGIAHDFNNILTTIMGNVSVAMRKARGRDGVVHRLNEAEKAIQRASDLTTQLLTFSKGGAPIKTVVNVEKLIRESTEFALHGSSTKCIISTGDDLWSIEVDEGQIGQVIHNLTINADQAMTEGGTIIISASNVIADVADALPLNPGPLVRITIKDMGIGIERRYLDKIFDPYFTTKKNGTGLGLAAAYSIVRRHGGHITVDSKPGAGTTFCLFLPACYRRASRELTPVQLASPIGDGRVLVMDDEPTIRAVASDLLTEMGFEVELTADGQETLELYQFQLEQDRRFDVVIMDLTIPGGLGGKETVQLLKKIDPSAKVIISSGYSNDPIMSEYKKYGFDGVVTKPYGQKQLAKIMKKLIGEA